MQNLELKQQSWNALDRTQKMPTSELNSAARMVVWCSLVWCNYCLSVNCTVRQPAGPASLTVVCDSLVQTVETSGAPTRRNELLQSTGVYTIAPPRGRHANSNSLAAQWPIHDRHDILYTWHTLQKPATKIHSTFFRRRFLARVSCKSGTGFVLVV